MIMCYVFSIFVGIMSDFEWHPLVKHVEPADDVLPPPTSVNEPSKGGGDPIDARVN